MRFLERKIAKYHALVISPRQIVQCYYSRLINYMVQNPRFRFFLQEKIVHIDQFSLIFCLNKLPKCLGFEISVSWMNILLLGLHVTVKLLFRFTFLHIIPSCAFKANLSFVMPALNAMKKNCSVFVKSTIRKTRNEFRIYS